MKYLLSLIVVLLLFTGCREDTVQFSLDESTADIFVNSFPRGADIYLNNQFTGEVTPYTIKYLEPGSHSVTLRLEGYKDTTVTLAVEFTDDPTIFVSMEQL